MKTSKFKSYTETAYLIEKMRQDRYSMREIAKKLGISRQWTHEIWRKGYPQGK